MSATDQLGSDVTRMLKDHLRSWRHSAETATNARGSKVIDGRLYDARRILAANLSRADSI
jgi:hypothetical protein